MPSVIESVFEDFDDLDLEGVPEGEVVGVEVWKDAEGVPMGIGTDVWDEKVVETEVVVQLSSTSKTIWSKTALVLRVVPTTSTSSTRSFFQHHDRRRQGWPLNQRRLRGYRGVDGRGASIGPPGAPWKCRVERRRYTNNVLRGGRTRQLNSLLAQIAEPNGGKRGRTFAPESLANI